MLRPSSGLRNSDYRRSWGLLKHHHHKLWILDTTNAVVEYCPGRRDDPRDGGWRWPGIMDQADALGDASLDAVRVQSCLFIS